MRRYFLLIAVMGIVLVPTVASAAPDWFPIVPCGVGGAPTCTPCDIFKTFKNIIDLVLYGITGPIAAFMIVWAGGYMLLSGANPALYAQGTKMLTNTMYGIAIILLSWVATNTLIKSLASGNEYDAWYEFSCPAAFILPPAAPIPTPVPGAAAGTAATAWDAARQAACKVENLAAAYKLPVHQVSEYKAPPNGNQSLNAPSLNALIACILQDPIVKKAYDPAKLFTYEVDNPFCNLTHGLRTCGQCAHSVYSCHYGGRTGTLGAMAVDFNFKTPVMYEIATRAIVTGTSEVCKKEPNKCRTVRDELGLADEVFRSAVKNKCKYKFIYFEKDHTHMSAPECSSDGGGTKGLAPPVIP